MKKLSHLFDSNKTWSDSIRQQDPDFFLKLTEQQFPQYLWIGCADSRVPATQIVDMLPGEMFVHRNIANQVIHTDLNCLSVIQFAVDVLKVKHIIVCGHYGCSGVQAALQKNRIGLSDNWLRHVQDVHEKYHQALAKIPENTDICNRLCELNVIEQVIHVCQTTMVCDAWERGQEVSVHGWIYGLSNGRLRDLNITISELKEMNSVYQQALSDLS